MEPGPRRTRAAYFSAALIVAFWASQFRFLGATGPLSVTLPEAFLIVVIMYTIIIGTIAFLVILEGESYAGLGFSRLRMRKQLLFGALLGLAMFLFGQVLVAPVVAALLPGKAPIQITAWFQDLSYIPLWLVMIVYGGGIGEELTRVFVLTRFEKLWGRSGLAIAVVAHAVTFGMAHLYQGTHVAIGIGISNLVYSLIFLRRRSAVELILAHITFDVIGVTLGFFMLYQG